MLEQSAERLPAADVAQRKCRLVGDGETPHRGRPDEQFVLTSLMGPSGVVTCRPNLDDVIQVLCAEEDEMVQAFATNRTDEAFHERLGVRRLRRTGAASIRKGFQAASNASPNFPSRAR